MKIIAVGRNYADHAKELNNPVPVFPVIFMKPDTAVLKDYKPFYHPDFSSDIHYEIEVVLKVCKEGKHIAEKFAANYYDEIGLGIDFTARDIQKQCKEQGLPWEKAKAFDCSAVISKTFIDKNKLKIADLNFSLTKNDQIVQNGNTSDMIFTIDLLISHISKYVTLKVGDLIYTGILEGVGPVKIGDKLCGFIEGDKQFELNIL